MLIIGLRSKVAMLAVAALAAAACSKKDNYASDTTAAASSTTMGDTSAMSTNAPASGTWSDANIVAMLDEANAVDSAAGAIAASKATSSEVREFARRMTRDHHQLRAQGAALATKAAGQTQNSELKNLIQQAAPVIQGHLTKAESIQKTLK